MNIKEAFNWLSEKPQRNYTLGEAFQRHILHKKPEEVSSNMLGFSRAGRIIERAILLSSVARGALLVGAGLIAAALYTVPAILVGGAALLIPPAIVGMTSLAAVFGVACTKPVSVIAGKITDFVVRGVNRVAQSPKQGAKQAAPTA